MKKILLSFVVSLFALVSNAQIGYQVSLLNTATGEPRANETVSCTVKLMNSEGAVICNETKSVTSNDLGVLSLTVGGPKTFAEMDWTKLPLSVSVSVGGQLIGQSQVLTVPVAECARAVVPNKDIIGGWHSSGKGWSESLYLGELQGNIGYASITGSYPEKDSNWSYTGSYYILGNIVCVCCGEKNLMCAYMNGRLYTMLGEDSNVYSH